MIVKKAVVHSLIKTEGEQKALVDLSMDLLDIDIMSNNLMQRLDASYRKADIINAVFDKTTGYVFPKEYHNYISDQNDKSFLNFSHSVMNNLREKVENLAPAKGGFLVFSDYEELNRHYVSVFLIRDTVGMLFKKDKSTASYIINPTEHLDLDKLAMACKIDSLRYKANNGKYLSFLKRKMETISEYFINWVAAKEQVSSKIFTDNLYNIANQIDLPLDEKGNKISRVEFKAKIFDYVSSLPSGIINLHTLGAHFYEDDLHFTEFATTNNIEIDTEFQVNRKSMKDFVRIDLESDGVHIRFFRSELNKKVRFDPDNANIVIIESQKFAEDLKIETDHHGTP